MRMGANTRIIPVLRIATADDVRYYMMITGSAHVRWAQCHASDDDTVSLFGPDAEPVTDKGFEAALDDLYTELLLEEAG